MKSKRVHGVMAVRGNVSPQCMAYHHPWKEGTSPSRTVGWLDSGLWQITDRGIIWSASSHVSGPLSGLPSGGFNQDFHSSYKHGCRDECHDVGQAVCQGAAD